MSEGQINRRGLLGILAAAPVVAVAKPAAAAFDDIVGGVGLHGSAVPERHGFMLTAPAIDSGWVIHEGSDFSMFELPGGERYAVLSGETVRRLAAPIDDYEIAIRPPEGSGLADGLSDARRSERSAPTAAVDAPAAASDQTFDHPVLKHARAC